MRPLKSSGHDPEKLQAFRERSCGRTKLAQSRLSLRAATSSASAGVRSVLLRRFSVASQDAHGVRRRGRDSRICRERDRWSNRACRDRRGLCVFRVRARAGWRDCADTSLAALLPVPGAVCAQAANISNSAFMAYPAPVITTVAVRRIPLPSLRRAGPTLAHRGGIRQRRPFSARHRDRAIRTTGHENWPTRRLRY